MKSLFRTLVILFLGGSLNVWANIVISSPTGNSVTSPVNLQASVSGQTPNAILVYDNNSLVYRNSGVSSVNTSLTLSAGTHTLQVVAQYRRRSDSATTTITVSSQGTTPSGSSNVAAQIADDMQGENEGHPHGVPLSYDWANGPVISMGNNSDGWQAITAWGVLYEAAEGNPATNTRVNIRDMQAFLLSKSTGQWLELQSTSEPEGAAYLEDFSGDTNKPADVRTEPDGTISATAGGGYNFHFYPVDRASIDPNDIGGIVVVYQARLIVGDPSKPDDRSIARYLCSAGADYYPGLTGGWPGNSTSNPGVGIGKMKYVESQWRSFAMTTISESQLASNPPPINLSGILP